MSRKAGALTNVAASVHQRLLNLSRLRQRPFNEVVQYYAMERFLARLIRTPHAEHLVLKGALALRTWTDINTRATRDIDFMADIALGSPQRTIDAVQRIIMECAVASIEPDGVHFTDEAGIRATFRGLLGTTRLTMQVDVGIGDAVEPPPVWVSFSQLLIPDPIRVLAYALETIVAEKFHAIVARDLTNTRIKDFFDVWTIGRLRQPDGAALAAAIAATFDRRGTPIPQEPPAGLTAYFATDTEKVAQWKAFWRKTVASREPPLLADVVGEVSAWLMPVCAMLRSRDTQR